jgi:TPP-dependent indolepyruvate ferredoxin oxidoreductase alpha subunit
MTTPDPTLAARLASLKMHHTDEYIREIQAAYRSSQLITLADAEAMNNVAFENGVKACAAWGGIPESQVDSIVSAIRARVKPHNNEVA